MEKQDITIDVKFFNDCYSDTLDFIGGEKSNWIDLRVSEDISLNTGEYKLIPLGVAMKLPDGFEAIVAPRSSTFKNFGIIMTNSIGIIDNSYSGNNDQWHFPAYALRDTKINKGDRICQFRIQRSINSELNVNINVVERLEGADRGGIGSTGIL